MASISSASLRWLLISLRREMMLVPRSSDRSSTKIISGVRRKRTRCPISLRTRPVANCKPAIVSLRTSSEPKTLTNTFACCKSPDKSTAVTLTIPVPPRSTFNPDSSICPISRFICSATLSTRRGLGIIRSHFKVRQCFSV